MTDGAMTDLPMTDGPMTDLPMTDGPMTDLPMTDGPMTVGRWPDDRWPMERVIRMSRGRCTAIALLIWASACSHNPTPVAPQPSAVAPQPPSPAAPSSRPVAPMPPEQQPVPARPAPPAIVPLPVIIETRSGDGFTITGTTVLVAAPDAAVQRTARQIAEWIRRGTGLAIGGSPPAGADPAAVTTIGLVLDPALTAGREGYDLTIGPKAVTLAAATPAGVFYGAQTLRQLLPYWSEYEAIMYRQPRPATLPPLHIRDTPRYEWRGAMLDVARHFFSLDEVKGFIDLLAMNKMNRLHLHLADDQGWRLEIRKWPDLTAKGGQTEVGGTPGGFYTQAQFAELVAYAAERFVTIVPEIDMPGHTNAALSSIDELNCNGQSTPRFTGTAVGFSALCVDRDFTYKFLDDVIGEIAAMTPGLYFHAGGDEVRTLTPEQYRMFVERVQSIVHAHGKQMIGWDEVAATTLLPTSIVQHWRPDAGKAELARAPHLILSPGNRAYLDMKYDSATALGLNWAGLIPLQTSYDWDPDSLVPGAASILGVEAPLWSETVANMRDVEFLALPRLAAIAEVAWSPQSIRDWEGFRVRIGAQALRWTALGLNFYRAPEISWAK
jgi:hexosaminidase